MRVVLLSPNKNQEGRRPCESGRGILNRRGLASITKGVATQVGVVNKGVAAHMESFSAGPWNISAIKSHILRSKCEEVPAASGDSCGSCNVCRYPLQVSFTPVKLRKLGTQGNSSCHGYRRWCSPTTD